MSFMHMMIAKGRGPAEVMEDIPVTIAASEDPGLERYDRQSSSGRQAPLVISFHWSTGLPAATWPAPLRSAC
jgi:beta-galactosidase GanA